MGFSDLIFFTIYLIILSIFFKAVRSTYKDPILKKYYRQGFWIKIIGCITFCIYSVYLLPGSDSTSLYQTEGNNLYHLILQDPRRLEWLFQRGDLFNESYLKDTFNVGYFSSEANFMVIRLVTIFSFITGGSYAAISLIFACIAFSGVWKLFLFFYEQYPHLHKKLAIAILFFPSFIFWSAGILKDTLCIASLGWITYALYEILYRKKNIIKSSIVLFLFGYLLAILKIYIFISYAPFFILFILLKNIKQIKSTFLKFILAPILVLACIFGFTQIMDSFDEELGGYAVEGLTSSVQKLNDAYVALDGNSTAESNFSLGVEFDGSLEGIAKLAPAAIFTTFFRPFIWESHKISQLLASLESLVLLFFTLYIIFKSGPFRFIKIIFTDPIIMYCFLFSLVFATFVGASTLNFGTLVRYKIPCLPFYAISLFLIYEKVKIRAAKKSGVVFEDLHAEISLIPC